MVNPRLFIVRVWCQTTRFRAVVRDVAQERAHLFDSPETVVHFLTKTATDGIDDGQTAAVPPPPNR